VDAVWTGEDWALRTRTEGPPRTFYQDAAPPSPRLMSLVPLGFHIPLSLFASGHWPSCVFEVVIFCSVSGPVAVLHQALVESSKLSHRSLRLAHPPYREHCSFLLVEVDTRKALQPLRVSSDRTNTSRAIVALACANTV